MKNYETPGLTTTLEQLVCFLKGPIFDGDLVSKEARDRLVKSEMIFRANGYQSLTDKGVRTLIDLGFLNQ
jgi:hypothetical protein